MTAALDRVLADRLVAETRADDGRMLDAFNEFGDSYLIRTRHGAYGTASVVTVLKRNSDMADQLEAALSEVARLRVLSSAAERAVESLEGIEQRTGAELLAARARIRALEDALREALSFWRYPQLTAGEKFRKDEIWLLVYPIVVDDSKPGA
jgi:hypothetical protein